MRLRRRRSSKPPLLVFIHIPRTAGTAFRTVLALNEVSTPARALGNVFKGSGGVDHDLVRRLRRMRGSGASGLRLVRGHVPLAYRDRLDDEREPRCFTFLRDPVDRMLSHFFVVQDEHAGSKLVDLERTLDLPPLADDATLDDAITAGYLHDNLQTRMLSNAAQPFGEVTDAMLEQATENLDSLVFFGLSERFDESLIMARRRLELDCVLHSSSPRLDRVNTTRPRERKLPASLVEAAERANQYDLELYRRALERFDSNPELGQLDFQVEVAALRVARSPGEIGVPRPAPPSFDGSPEVWRRLVRTTAQSQRLEYQLAEQRMKSSSARSKMEHLQGQVDELERGRPPEASRSESGERLDSGTARVRELEAEVLQLRAHDERRTRDLDDLTELLHAAEERARELEHELGEVRAAPAGRRPTAKRAKSPPPRTKRAAKAGARKRAHPAAKHATGKRRTEARGDDG